MNKLIAAYNSGKMSFGQLEGNSQILIAAGSETTATHLSGKLQVAYHMTSSLIVLTRMVSQVSLGFS